MASSRDDFVIAFRSAFLKKENKQKFSLFTLLFISILIIILSIPLLKFISGPSISKIESINAATSGFLGGMNLPIIFSWFFGALLSAGVAFVIGKVCLGLRSDYLAISTLLISGIIVSIVKHEEWLSRGVKNVIGLKRPAPYEVDLQSSDWFIRLVEFLNTSKFFSNCCNLKICFFLLQIFHLLDKNLFSSRKVYWINCLKKC